MSEQLLPCPFCGGPAEIWRTHENPARTAWVACMDKCSVLVTRDHKTDEEAIAAWNRRATPPSQEEKTWTVDCVEFLVEGEIEDEDGREPGTYLTLYTDRQVSIPHGQASVSFLQEKEKVGS